MNWRESSKFRIEAETIENMVKIFCHGNHGGGAELCAECSGILEYSLKKLSLCPFALEKSKCSECRVHCYAPEMREKIREVMKYAGPRMLLHHPVQSLRHLTGK